MLYGKVTCLSNIIILYVVELYIYYHMVPTIDDFYIRHHDLVDHSEISIYEMAVDLFF